MLRERLDKVPWERFFRIVNWPLTMRPYPDPDTCSRVWATLVGALLALVFPWNVWKDDSIGANPVLTAVLFFALAAMGVLAVLAILMSIRSLRNRPGLSYFSMQYAIGCLRLSMWVMSVYLTALILSDELFVDNEQQFISVLVICQIAVFVLGEAIWNLFVFHRTVSRIEQNKYRPNGPGFWDGEKPWKLLYVLIAIVMFSEVGFRSARVFWHSAEIYLGLEYGITDITSLDAYERMEYRLMVVWSLVTIMTCVMTTFANAKMWVVLYCFKRFGSKYVPPEEKEK